jgi:hypothetical protein
MAYSTIDNPELHFQAKPYSGNGGTQSITLDGSEDMQPDWVWIKVRSQAHNHYLYDAVRGAQEKISSNTNGAEVDMGSTGLTAFNSDGFSMGNDTDENASGQTYASWCWKANGSGSANTAGTINTTATSANTTAGFSISKYTGNATNGASVGHGLGAVPDMIIGKDLSDTSGWCVWHESFTNIGYRQALDTQNAQSDDTALFGGSSRVEPTSTVFTLGSGGGLNGTNANVVYCFTSIKGYSKFSSYNGNSSTDGTFVYLGFKPAFLICKPIDASDNWVMFDNKRHDAINSSTAPYFFYANKNFAETTDTKQCDFLSNGFKIRSSGNTINRSGPMLYMAFAESPFVNSNGVPNNAG